MVMKREPRENHEPIEREPPTSVGVIENHKLLGRVMTNQTAIQFHDLERESPSFFIKQVLVFSNIRLPSPIYQRNWSKGSNSVSAKEPLGFACILKTPTRLPLSLSHGGR
jgi:hypothetical protein